ETPIRRRAGKRRSAIVVTSPRARASDEQSRGELVSGGETTRAQAAAVQVGPIRPTLPQHARRRPQYLQPPTPPHFAIHTADLPSRSCCRVARCCRSSMTRAEL